MNQLTDEEFILLRDFISHKCGVFYNIKQKFLLEQKLKRQLSKNSLKSFKEYYYFLKYTQSQRELQEVFNLLTVNETFFFREEEHFNVLINTIIPELKKSRKKIRILSAGCSTGEEAYTISIKSFEKFINPKSFIEIIGLDLNENAVKKAISGEYRKISLSFRSIEQRYLEKYFDDLKQSYQLIKKVKEIVHFEKENLINLSKLQSKGKFDIIFCRNVMIYFNNQFKNELVNTYYKMLNENGYLIVSCTENLNSINSDFKTKQISKNFFYQKTTI